MSSQDPFALLITWTCYGTWLPGDRRGYVSDTFRPEGGVTRKKNVPGTEITADDRYTHQQALKRQKRPQVLLTRQQAVVAARAMVEAARDRDWRIVRGSVMLNHVHVVVMDCPDDGPAVRRVLKGVSQARLSKHFG